MDQAAFAGFSFINPKMEQLLEKRVLWWQSDLGYISTTYGQFPYSFTLLNLQMNELFHYQYLCDLILSTNHSPWVRVEMISVETGSCTVHIDSIVFVCMLVICLGCESLYE